MTAGGGRRGGATNRSDGGVTDCSDGGVTDRSDGGATDRSDGGATDRPGAGLTAEADVTDQTESGATDRPEADRSGSATAGTASTVAAGAETVAVVGAGAVGTTAARDLAVAGASVTLFDRDGVGAGSTGRAAGICYDAFADPTDARLAERAMERFRALSGRGDFELTRAPYVWLAREGDDSRAAAIREQVPRMRAAGRDVELLAPDDLGAAFPAVRADDVAVAAVARNAGHADPADYAALLADLARRAGATVRTGTAVGVRHDPPRVVVDGRDERFDAVLVAAGAWTPGVLADAGVAVPLKPYRAQALTTTEAPDVPMLYDATAGVYLRPRGDGLLAGDGTEPVAVDPDGYDRSADGWFREETTAVLERRVRGFDPSVADAWAGVCTATPDRDPLVGAVRPGLYVAAGWQGHGFMRAPALGEVAAAVVLGGDGVAAFDPGRFSGDEEFEIVEGMAVEER